MKNELTTENHILSTVILKREKLKDVSNYKRICMYPFLTFFRLCSWVLWKKMLAKVWKM